MAEDVELIRKIDFFAELDSKIIRKIAEVCIDREYSAGDYVITQGETGLGLFFIHTGKVKVEVEKSGTRTVVANLKDEDFFGELSIIDNKPRSASVVCLENTRCMLLTRDSFSKLMNKYPEISIQMARALAQRIRETTEKVSAFPQPAVFEPPAAAASGAASPVKAVAVPVASPGTASPVTTSADSPSSNGGSTARKNQVRDLLVGAFSRLYTLKALTRFSVAVVGCPVMVAPQNRNAAWAVLDEVKVCVFPAEENQILNIEAFGDGSLSAIIFRPEVGGFSKVKLSAQIRCDDRLRIHVPPKSQLEPWLDDASVELRVSSVE